MCHATRRNESWHAWTCITAAYCNRRREHELCRICVCTSLCVMSHIETSHVTHICASRYAYTRVIATQMQQSQGARSVLWPYAAQMSHVTQIKMSHIEMSHVLSHGNSNPAVSRCTKCAVSVRSADESCHTQEWVTSGVSHIQMGQVARKNGSRHVYIWVKFHIKMSHGISIATASRCTRCTVSTCSSNESCHTS